MSRMRLRPIAGLLLRLPRRVRRELQADPPHERLRRTSAGRGAASPAAGRARCASPRTPRSARSTSHSLRGNAALELLPKRLTLEGSADYDLVNEHPLADRAARLRYAVQCCGFSVEYIRYNWNGRDEKQWRFNLELANVGSMGNFLGAGARRRPAAASGATGEAPRHRRRRASWAATSSTSCARSTPGVEVHGVVLPHGSVSLARRRGRARPGGRPRRPRGGRRR